MPRRPILLALLVAVVDDGRRSCCSSGPATPARTATHVAVGEPAPRDRRHDARRRAVRPGGLRRASRSSSTSGARRCVPCRDEFPLLEAKLAAARRRRAGRRRRADRRPGRAGARLRRPSTARPGRRSSTRTRRSRPPIASRPGRRPTSSTGTGSSASIQVGELTDADFERQYAADRPVSGGRRRPAGRRRRAGQALRRRGPCSTASRCRSAAGELVALLGPNGAGKTTTVEIVEGYRRADGGRVARPRARIRRPAGRALRARVGLMLQGGGIDPRARPRETLVQYGRFHADPRDPDELLDLVGLRRGRADAATGGCPAASGSGSGSRWPSSAGPRSSILDEPTAGHGPRGAGPRPGRSSPACATRASAILLTSHDLTDVERLADRIVHPRRRPDRRGGDARRAARPGATAAAPVPARPGARRGRASPASRRALAGVRPGAARRGRRRRRPLPGRGRRARTPALVAALAGWCADGGPADRRAADGRRQPRGRLPRARRRDAGGRRRRPARRSRPDEPAGLAAGRDPRPDRDGAAADRAPRRERPGHDRHPGRRPAVLRLGRRPADRRAAGRSTSCCPGSLALAVIATSLVNLGIATAYERHYGVLKRLGGSPLTRGGLLAAKMIAVLVVEVAQVVLLVAIAVAVLGWRAGPGASPALLVVALLLGTLAFAGLGPADGRRAPGRGDAGPRQRAVPRVPAARRDRPPARPPARAAGGGRAAPPGGGPRRRLPGRPGLGRRSRCGPIAILVVWGVGAVALDGPHLPLGVRPPSAGSAGETAARPGAVARLP